ncbi:MAG: hypothetical protein ACI4XM_03835 [Candidatus Coprovivens sp.]
MNITGPEKLWLYLRDDKRVVNENMYTCNRYLYTTKFAEMLYLNPEYIPELKLRMTMERLNDTEFFLKLRNGYGKTEYRIIKMMQVENVGRIIMKYFPELIPDEKTKQNNL